MLAGRFVVTRNALSNLRKETRPLGYLSLMFEDAAGRDTLVITPRGTGSGATDSAQMLSQGLRAHVWFDGMSRDKLTQTVSPTLTLPNSRVVTSDTVRLRSVFDAEGHRVSATRFYTRKLDTAPSGFFTTLPSEWTYDALKIGRAHV